MLDEMSQFLVHMSNIPVYSLIELVDLVNLRRIVEIAAVSFTNWSFPCFIAGLSQYECSHCYMLKYTDYIPEYGLWRCCVP